MSEYEQERTSLMSGGPTTRKVEPKKIELRINAGRLNDKIILEMDEVSAGWLIEQLTSPAAEWSGKRAELAALLKACCQ